jgi:anti-sigma B factor antagonist
MMCGRMHEPGRCAEVAGMVGVSQLELVRDDAPDGGVVIIVRGDIDMATVPALRSALDDAVDDGASRVVLDCRALEFLDSSGIGVLVAAQQRLGDVGELVIDSPPANVRKVLDITGVASHLTVR